MIYRLGVDGGGTKTEMVLTGDGAEIARQAGPACNPSVVGPAEAKRVVGEGLRQIVEPVRLREPSLEIDATLLCLAGNRAFWQEFAASLTGFGRAVAVDDSLPVLELATGGSPGLVLHAGTGSFVAARAPGRSGGPFGAVHYAGGLGWRFGDPGSGYDLGRAAVARGLMELQGWQPVSGVSRFVVDRTGRSEAGAISRSFYDDPAANPKISELAPGLLELTLSGDPVARDLVAQSVTALLDLAHGVADRLFAGTPREEIPAGLSGPILNHPFVREVLAARTSLQLLPVTAAPIEGVKRLLTRF
jgi:N-acetylglucosamine kinase-like BadF-type ATPase